MTQKIVNRMKLEVTDDGITPTQIPFVQTFEKLREKKNNGEKDYENIGLANSNLANVKPVQEGKD